MLIIRWENGCFLQKTPAMKSNKPPFWCRGSFFCFIASIAERRLLFPVICDLVRRLTLKLIGMLLVSNHHVVI